MFWDIHFMALGLHYQSAGSLSDFVSVRRSDWLLMFSAKFERGCCWYFCWNNFCKEIIKMLALNFWQRQCIKKRKARRIIRKCFCASWWKFCAEFCTYIFGGHSQTIFCFGNLDLNVPPNSEKRVKRLTWKSPNLSLWILLRWKIKPKIGVRIELSAVSEDHP